MEKKQTVVASDALTKDQIRELAVKSLAGIKNSYARGLPSGDAGIL